MGRDVHGQFGGDADFPPFLDLAHCHAKDGIGERPHEPLSFRQRNKLIGGDQTLFVMSPAHEGLQGIDFHIAVCCHDNLWLVIKNEFPSLDSVAKIIAGDREIIGGQ